MKLVNTFISKISYILNNLFQLYMYFWTQLFFLSRSWFMNKIITVLGYKNFIAEMSYAPGCIVHVYYCLCQSDGASVHFYFTFLYPLQINIGVYMNHALCPSHLNSALMPTFPLSCYFLIKKSTVVCLLSYLYIIYMPDFSI